MDTNFIPILIPLDLLNKFKNNIGILDNFIHKVNKLNINKEEDKLKLELELNNLRIANNMLDIESILRIIKDGIVFYNNLSNYLLINKKINYTNSDLDNMFSISDSLKRYVGVIGTVFTTEDLFDTKTDSVVKNINISLNTIKENYHNVVYDMPKSNLKLIGYSNYKDNLYFYLLNSSTIYYNEYIKFLVNLLYTILITETKNNDNFRNLEKTKENLFYNFYKYFCKNL